MLIHNYIHLAYKSLSHATTASSLPNYLHVPDNFIFLVHLVICYFLIHTRWSH